MKLNKIDHQQCPDNPRHAGRYEVIAKYNQTNPSAKMAQVVMWKPGTCRENAFPEAKYFVLEAEVERFKRRLQEKYPRNEIFHCVPFDA